MRRQGITVLIYNANEPLPKQGGMERITDRLACGLREKGIRTILLCSRRNRLGENYNAPVSIYYLPPEKKKEFLIDLIEKNSVSHIIDQAEGGIIGKFGIFKKKTEISAKKEQADLGLFLFVIEKALSKSGESRNL